MSEFECSNRHLMPSGTNKCPECGAKLAYMDGYSKRELEAMDRDDHDCDEEEEEGV